jgi:hypothetical protein
MKETWDIDDFNNTTNKNANEEEVEEEIKNFDFL